MQKKYYYCQRYSKKLEHYLNSKEIKYTVAGDGVIVSKFLCFTINDGTLSDPTLRKMLHSAPIVTNEFSRQELCNAEYLTIRPTRQVIDITNTEEAFTYRCERKSLFGHCKFEHQEQIGQFRIKRIHTKGKTMFFSSTTGYAEIFAKEEIREFIRNNNIVGVCIKPVMLDRGETSASSGIVQLCPEKIISASQILIEKGLKVRRCPMCGGLKVLCKPDYQLKLIGAPTELADDFYMTESIFGEGFSYPIYIISQRMYQLLDCAKLTRNVKFEPVMFTNA